MNGRLHRPFIVRYVLGLTLFGLLTVVGHAALVVYDHKQSISLTQWAIASDELTQTQAALGDALLVQASASERASASGSLTAMLNLISEHDRELLYGGGDQRLPPANASERAANAGPDGLAAHLQNFILAGRVVAAPDSDAATTGEAIAVMQAELAGPLTDAFDRLVSVYSANARHHEHISSALGPIILFGSLLIIIAEGPLIFAPMSRRIRTEVRRLAAAEAHQRHEADHDGLTGLVNRRYLSGLVTAYEADGIDYVLMLSDVDHFKSVNDTLGHDVGDQVLLAFAAVLNRTAGKLPGRELPAKSSLAGQQAKVVAGRLGGDEFLVILPLASRDEAAAVFLEARGALPEELARRELPRVTTSWGVSDGGPGRPWSAALKAADNALYLAKQKGRNRLATEQDLAKTTCN